MQCRLWACVLNMHHQGVSVANAETGQPVERVADIVFRVHSYLRDQDCEFLPAWSTIWERFDGSVPGLADYSSLVFRKGIPNQLRVKTQVGSHPSAVLQSSSASESSIQKIMVWCVNHFSNLT